MPVRFFSPFPSLDFFGKSIPGVILSVLLVSLLPVTVPKQTIESRTAIGFTTSEIVLLLLGVIVFGFVVGQGLHTTAVLIERAAFAVGRSATRSGREGGRTDRSRLPARVRTGLGGAAKRWLSDRWVKTAFEPHREMFEREVRETVDGADDNAMVDAFVDACRDRYGNRFVEDDGVSYLYPLVLSDLNNWEDNRAGRFQSSYTFSRSVWVEFLTVSVVYAAISLDPAGVVGIYSETPPVIAQVAPGNTAVAAVALFVLAINFMYASSIYKNYFVQYVFADFINYTARETT